MTRVLVVVDMQKDFITGPLGNAECSAAVPEVTKVIRDGKYDMVCVTYDTHTEDYLNTQEGKKLPVVHCVKESDGWKLDEAVEEALEQAYEPDNISVFEKPTFGSVDLARTMRMEYGDGKELLVDFVGVCTGICVISNAMTLKAFCPEAKLRVLAKACACVTPQSHKTALEAMKLCQIEIVEE